MRRRPLTGRFALAVLHRYPPAWRERYEHEITALIEDSRLAWTDVAELVRGMLEERAHELVQSDERPRRTAFVLSTLRCLFGVAFVGAVFVVADLLRRLTGVPAESTAETLVFAWVPLFLAFVVVLWRIRSGPLFGSQPPYPAWAAFTMLPIWFLLVTIPVWAVDWTPPESSILPGWLGYLVPVYNLFLFGFVAVGLAGALLPGRRFLFALSHLTVLEQQTQSAQQLVDGCHDMIAKGISSPLADAEAALTRLTRERDATRARLRAMGYRARFRHPGTLAPWDPGTSS